MTTFIDNLYRILYRDNIKTYIRYNRCYFYIDDIRFLKNCILPVYFNNIKYHSFTRQLSYYGINYSKNGNILEIHSRYFTKKLSLTQFKKIFKRNTKPKYDKFEIDMRIFDLFPLCINSFPYDTL